ncbi:MAG: NAD(P)/FAD-dependent oxidoreductase [Gemmatimonadetes bacterium]|nr:NAD(P)/FAD-dependent oxidoreductase [Gemmatimonadota bacterium]
MSDAVVVGAGPNGLAAAIALARAGIAVLVREAQPEIGGGARTQELTLPGFQHDVCAAVHPLGAASPFFRTLPLAQHGLEWIQPPAALAHPFDDGTAAVLERSTADTGETLGRDARAYRKLMDPLVRHWDTLLEDVLAPQHFPRHPLAMAGFARGALRSAAALAGSRFLEQRARALVCGSAAHSALPLNRLPSAAFGLVLAIAGHAVGWPIARGGSQSLVRALAAHLAELGGRIETGVPVTSADELADARALLLDLTPRQALRVVGPRLSGRYRRRLERYRYGPAVFKMDWALSAPIPWRAPECARAATVHVGGTADEIDGALQALWRGEHAERPFVILAQPSLFDDTRAPAGRHTAWAYCHVPLGSSVDMTTRIEAQIERFAPGFRELILARNIMGPAALERHNPNLVGGDIAGGSVTLRQVLFRPVPRRVPYATPDPAIFLCSSSTPPGPGVHGMCGFHAARAALRRRFSG